MAKRPLETTGDNAHLYYATAGTLSLAGAACGTLTAGTLTSGVFGDGFLAIDTTSLHELAIVIDITANEIEIPEVKTDKLPSQAATSQPGYAPDHGEVTVTIPYSATVSAQINALIAAQTIQFYEITPDDFTVPSQNAFLAWVKKWPPIGKEFKKGERQVCDLTLKITGKGAFTAGS